MTKPVSTVAALAFLAALAIIGLATAQAKQQCSTSAGHQGYWSWRMIDDRKCWYEGRPGLSKDLLEWSAEAPVAKPQAGAAPAADAAPATVAPAKRHAPAADAAPATDAPAMRHSPGETRRSSMDARAQVPDDSSTFEALWRTRIGY